MIPKILIKYPSRGRKERFFEGMDSIVNNLYDTENYLIAVTFDVDDEAMNNDEVRNRLSKYKNTVVNYGVSVSKIHAINRDMPDYDFDIIVCMADDMRFTFYGWDQILRQEFLDGDFDKLIHLIEPDAGTALATMYIAGKDFYSRFGFIYNPEYVSLFCDQEVMDIAIQLGKYKLCDCRGVLIHYNPAYNWYEKDEMFLKQQEIGWTTDHETYNRRRAKNFDL